MLREREVVPHQRHVKLSGRLLFERLSIRAGRAAQVFKHDDGHLATRRRVQHGLVVEIIRRLRTEKLSSRNRGEGEENER